MARRKTTMAAAATVTLTSKRAATLLCCAFEGGSNYWYMIDRMIAPTTVNEDLGDLADSKHLSYPLSLGGALIIADQENNNKKYVLDLAAVQRGWEVMLAEYPHHAADVLKDNDDAVTGDVFLQCCLFGDVVYG